MKGDNTTLNIIDISKKAGVSTATVSRYFNNPEKISKKKFLAIQEIVKKYDYKPNALARSLIKRETKSIGIISPDINNLFYPVIIRGVEDVLHKNGYSAFVCNTDEKIEKEKMYINTLLEKRVDGLIVIGTRYSNLELNEHLLKVSEKLPVIVVSECVKSKKIEENICSIFSKEIDGAYEAVKHLLELGHKDIAFLSSIHSNTTYDKKRQGYVKALKEFGITIRDEYIICDVPYAKGGYDATQKIFQLKNKPTAVFAVSDQMAVGVIKAMYEKKLRVPEDLAIVGFSGISIGMDIYPELTTIDQTPYKMGTMASDIIIKMLTGEMPISKTIPLNTQLIVRGSTVK